LLNHVFIVDKTCCCSKSLLLLLVVVYSIHYTLFIFRKCTTFWKW